jgi:hypothetical protein
MIVIFALAGVAAVVMLTLAPFFLPWPSRLRWTIAISTVPDPWGFAPTPWPGLEEVILQTLIPCPDGLMVVGLSGPAPGLPHSLWLPETTSPIAAQLEAWTAAATPLLQMGTEDGEVSLYGPTSSVSGLAQLLTTGAGNGATSDIRASRPTRRSLAQ